MRPLVTFARLSFDEKRVVCAAVLVLGVVIASLKTGGLATAEKRLARLPRLMPRGVDPRRVSILVDAVARRVPGALCLARSLTLAHLLRESTSSTVKLRIGVRHGATVPLDAHAWVELNGIVMNDATDVASRFSVIETR